MPMKNIYSLIISFLAVLQLSAQAPSAFSFFPDSNALWVSRFEAHFADMSSHYSAYRIECDYYTLPGDTMVIDSVVYKKLFLYGDYADPVPTLFAGIRQDSLHRVYMYFMAEQEEHKVYDFSLNVGDTDTITLPSGNQYAYTVIEVDYYPRGVDTSKTMKIQFSNYEEGSNFEAPTPQEWISEYHNWDSRGGDGEGLVWFYDYVSDRTGWMAKYNIFFSDTSSSLSQFSYCADEMSLNSQEQQISFVVYPIPAQDYLYVVNKEENKDIEYVITNALGVQEYAPKVINGAINVSGLMSGTYILTARKGGKYVGAKWFLKL
jgi:hypothetical protein